MQRAPITRTRPDGCTGLVRCDAFIFDDSTPPVFDDRYLYLACGKERGVRRLKVTNAYPRDCASLAWDWDEAYDLSPPNQVHALNVMCDPLQPRRFFAVEIFAMHIVEPGPPAINIKTLNEGFDTLGSRHDLAFVLMPGAVIGPPPYGPKKTVWVGSEGQVSHVNRVIDVTTNVNPVPIIDEFVGISTSDGAVMIGSDVYIPTFCGLVRYEQIWNAPNPPTWRQVPDSFMPAELPLDSGNTRLTEHVDTGVVPSLLEHPQRIYTCSGTGNFVEFQVNQISPPQLIQPVEWLREPTSSGLYPPGFWTNGYSNDAESGDLGPLAADKFVLVDWSDSSMPNNSVQYLMLAFRRQLNGTWKHDATFHSAVSAIPSGETFLSGTAITIAKGAGTPPKYFAFMGHGQGFFSVDLSKAYLGGLHAAADEVFFDTTIPHRLISTWSIAASRNRLFVFVNDPLPSTGAGLGNHIRIYDWNTSTGMVSLPAVGTITEGTLEGLLPNMDNPGRGWRARFLEKNPANGAGDVYFACEPYLLKFEWTGEGSANQDTLTAKAYWKSDYEQEMQDCRVYSSAPNITGPAILCVKNAETFAVIKETTVP